MVQWTMLVGAPLRLVVNMRAYTRKRLKEDASIGLDLSPGDSNIAEALIYIEALEEVEAITKDLFLSGMMDENPGKLLVRKALEKVISLRAKEDK